MNINTSSKDWQLEDEFTESGLFCIEFGFLAAWASKSQHILKLIESLELMASQSAVVTLQNS